MGQFPQGHGLIRFRQQAGAHLLRQCHLRSGAAMNRLRGWLQRAEKQQQLQQLYFQVSLADILRHGVKLRKDVLHPSGGPGGKDSAAGTQLFHQRRRTHFHIAQDAGQTFRRIRRINHHRDPMVMPGGKAAALRQ